MALAYGGAVSAVDLGPVKMYVWAAVRNGARYLYAQLYAGWRRRKTVYLGKDVNEVAGKIVSATADIGRTAGWYAAEKAAKKLLREFAVVKAVVEHLGRIKGKDVAGKCAMAFRDVVEAVFDLRAVEDVSDADPYEVEKRLEELGWLAEKYCAGLLAS